MARTQHVVNGSNPPHATGEKENYKQSSDEGEA